jgi:hypothetical protein
MSASQSRSRRPKQSDAGCLAVAAMTFSRPDDLADDTYVGCGCIQSYRATASMIKAMQAII